MPRARITIDDLKCVRQADSIGRDDVYWVANLRCADAVDPMHTDLTKIFLDEYYVTSLPEMLSIGAGQNSRFKRSVAFDDDCPVGSYLFGTIHFMERDTPLANYFARILQLLGIITAGLAIGAVAGLIIGWALGGLQAAIIGALIGVGAVALVGFFVGAVVQLVSDVDRDAHLGGMRISVGPLQAPPPDSDRETWRLSMTPAGKLEMVDAHGAELMTYGSSHTEHAVAAGHRYETALQLELTGGHR